MILLFIVSNGRYHLTARLIDQLFVLHSVNHDDLINPGLTERQDLHDGVKKTHFSLYC